MPAIATFIALLMTMGFLSACNNNIDNTAPAAMTAHPILNDTEYGNDASKYRGPSYQMTPNGTPVDGAR